MFSALLRKKLFTNNYGILKPMQALKNYSTELNYDKLVKNNKVVVFMKGQPQSPKCGFSNAVVQILRMHGVTYDAHDVLQDEEMREGVKKYSSWPTYPQVYINGEFVGGCDIILQMHQNGELIEELKKVGITSALIEKAITKKKQKAEK